MNKFIKDILEILIPVFTAYICMFGVIGLFLTYGGKLEDEAGLMLIPLLVSMIYGGYIGYKATENTNHKTN